MNWYYIKIAETLVVLLTYIFLRIISKRIIDKTIVKRFLQESRGITIKKFIDVASVVLVLFTTLLIWGVNQDDLALFVGSVLTVIGIAFFAQWSILSNITSSIIIFFNHPVKFNDTIMILENKDYVIEGKVVNLGMFFITLETEDLEKITLPNNLFIQKSIKVLSIKEAS